MDNKDDGPKLDQIGGVTGVIHERARGLLVEANGDPTLAISRFFDAQEGAAPQPPAGGWQETTQPSSGPRSGFGPPGSGPPSGFGPPGAAPPSGFGPPGSFGPPISAHRPPMGFQPVHDAAIPIGLPAGMARPPMGAPHPGYPGVPGPAPPNSGGGPTPQPPPGLPPGVVPRPPPGAPPQVMVTPASPTAPPTELQRDATQQLTRMLSSNDEARIQIAGFGEHQWLPHRAANSTTVDVCVQADDLEVLSVCLIAVVDFSGRCYISYGILVMAY